MTLSGARSRWGWIAAALLVGGCAQQVACTTVGCSSQVVVDIHQLSGLIQDKPFMAMLCVAGDCQMQAGQIAGSSPLLTVVKQLAVNGGPTFDSAAAVPVTLTVTTRDGKRVVEATGTVQLHKVTPNGETCGPVCYEASLSLSGTHLVEVSSS